MRQHPGPFLLIELDLLEQCRLEDEYRCCLHGANGSGGKIGPWRTIGSASRRGTWRANQSVER